MTARKIASSPFYDVGYGKPPRHTQFQKGRSGNPGGRPRRVEEIERLKALTLQEAYRGVVVRQENGIAEPAVAIQAILRSQIELAMNGNARAQRDVLNAVRAYERRDAEEAAMSDYVEAIAALGQHLIEADKRAAMKEKPKPVDYAKAARRIRELLGLDKCKSAVKTGEAESDPDGSETCTSVEDADTDARDSAQQDAASKQSADSKQPPADAAASADPPSSRSGSVPPPSAAKHPPPRERSEARGGGTPPLQRAAPPSASSADPRTWRSRPERYGRHRGRESTPSPGADSRARVLRTRSLHRRAGHSEPPFGVTWKNGVTLPYCRRPKSGNSLLSSLFSGKGR